MGPRPQTEHPTLAEGLKMRHHQHHLNMSNDKWGPRRARASGFLFYCYYSIIYIYIVLIFSYVK